MRFTAASRSCLRTRTVPLLGILGRADGDYEEGQVICRGCAWSKYPDSRQRDVQILTGFENARDRLTSESLEVPAIGASMLTPEKRHDIGAQPCYLQSRRDHEGGHAVGGSTRSDQPHKFQRRYSSAPHPFQAEFTTANRQNSHR